MKNLSADFRLTANQTYSVFVYSEEDLIRPFSTEIDPDHPLSFDGQIIDYEMIKAYRSGRMAQDNDGSFSVRENHPR